MGAKRLASRDSQFDAYFRENHLQSVKFNNSTCPQGL